MLVCIYHVYIYRRKWKITFQFLSRETDVCYKVALLKFACNLTQDFSTVQSEDMKTSHQNYILSVLNLCRLHTLYKLHALYCV